MGLLVVTALILVGFFAGRFNERRHLKQLDQLEEELENIPVITAQWKSTMTLDEEGQVFGGGIVIASDYFKPIVASLKSLVGGRLTSYESLLMRGRRAAIVKMKTKAANWGAHKIVNVRIETAKIGSISQKNQLPCVEIYAYGTAIRDSTKFDNSNKNK